jgi:hypothetical protein
MWQLINKNNLPVPNAAEWELKSQRLKTSSLSTLFHIESSPQTGHNHDTKFKMRQNCLPELYEKTTVII